MNGKKIVQFGLLLFAAVAVVILVSREAKRQAPGEGVGDATTGELPQKAVVAYYFHGDVRCPTCRNIEEYAREAIESGFAAQLAAGNVEWRVVNYEVPANQHFTTEYEIVAPTVVVVRTAEGRVADWRNLSRVWELVGEKDALMKYIRQETQAMLDATAG
jgi:hypothetical protein